jgi:hypothetical protein
MADKSKFTPFAIIATKPLRQVRDLLMITKEGPELAGRAEQAARAKYKNSEQWLGEGDAFRHMAWQALMAQKYGRIPAMAVGLAHEMGLGGQFGSPNQTAKEEEMDLANNALGRDIGLKSSDVNEMMKALEDAIATRKAQYLDENQRRGYKHMLFNNQLPEETQDY